MIKSRIVLIRVFAAIYRLILQDDLNQSVKNFLVNLFWSFLGGGLVSLIALLINILAGRAMGPLEYGKFNLVYTLGLAYLVPIYFGLNIAIVRVIATSHKKKDQIKDISSYCVFIALTAATFSLVYLLVFKKIAHWLQIENFLLLLALFYTVSTGAKSLLDNIVRGLRLFKLQFKTRVIESALVAVAFITLFMYLHKASYADYILALIIGALGAFLYNFWQLRHYFFDFDFGHTLRLLNEAKFYFVTTVFGTLFLSIDKLVIAKYLDLSQLGLYGAYYTASIILIAQANSLFMNVFFPTIANLDPRAMHKKIDNLFYRTSLPAITAIALMVVAVLKLFGRDYQLNIFYVLSFAIVATLQIFQEIYNAYIINLSSAVYKKYVLYGNSAVVLIMLLYVPMIYYNIVSIQNILFIYILNSFAVLGIQKFLIKTNLSKFTQ